MNNFKYGTKGAHLFALLVVVLLPSPRPPVCGFEDEDAAGCGVLRVLGGRPRPWTRGTNERAGWLPFTRPRARSREGAGHRLQGHDFLMTAEGGDDLGVGEASDRPSLAVEVSDGDTAEGVGISIGRVPTLPWQPRGRKPLPELVEDAHLLLSVHARAKPRLHLTERAGGR